ncbi:MAG TPA: DUF2911 domain-containing protein [Terriglobales bacterium]|jgi:hypothetical protein|nr:DUF2911 domain-containing protein [Terriglobales bacterium]
MRAVLVCTVLLSALPFACLASAQQAAAAADSESAICTLEDGKAITARYYPVSAGKDNAPAPGKVLIPGGAAMTFFTETDLMLGKTTIPTGAYTLYILPAKKDWTLIVSKNVTVDAKYDERLDLARATMEIGQLSAPEDKLSLYFGHTGAKKCEINVDYGKTRGWTEFREK